MHKYLQNTLKVNIVVQMTHNTALEYTFLYIVKQTGKARFYNSSVWVPPPMTKSHGKEGGGVISLLS